MASWDARVHAESAGTSDAASATAADGHGPAAVSGSADAATGTNDAARLDAAAAAAAADADRHASPAGATTGPAAARHAAKRGGQQHRSRSAAGPAAHIKITKFPSATTAGPQHPQIESASHGCVHQTADGEIPSQPTAAAEPTGHARSSAGNAEHGCNANRPRAETRHATSAAAAGRNPSHGRPRIPGTNDECCAQRKPAAVPPATNAHAAATGSNVSRTREIPATSRRSQLLANPHAAADGHAGRRRTHESDAAHGSDGPAWHGHGCPAEHAATAHAAAAAAATDAEAANGIAGSGRFHESPTPHACRTAAGSSPARTGHGQCAGQPSEVACTRAIAPPLIPTAATFQPVPSHAAPALAPALRHVPPQPGGTHAGPHGPGSPVHTRTECNASTAEHAKPWRAPQRVEYGWGYIGRHVREVRRGIVALRDVLFEERGVFYTGN